MSFSSNLELGGGVAFTSPVVTSNVIESEWNKVDATKEELDSESTPLVNYTSDNAVSPGDIRKLTSTPDKSKANSNKKQITFSSDIVLNGKNYRECSHHVTYEEKESIRYSQNSLVDRRANGKVEGRDVRVIETNPDRKVDIRGVENHQISAIPLVTAVGVTTTTTGEVIVIMHQHPHHGKKKP